MSRVRFPIVSLDFFIEIILPASLRSKVDSASNRNEYQEYFLGVKAAVVYGWQHYHFHAWPVLKFGSLKLVETSWPVQGLFTFIYQRNEKLKLTCELNFVSVNMKLFPCLNGGTQTICSKNCIPFHWPLFSDACNTHRQRNYLICIQQSHNLWKSVWNRRCRWRFESFWTNLPVETTWLQ